MSGSEDKQNNPLSQRDIEAEEMAQELMDMAMYEQGMNFEEMKQILQIVNESKNMAGIKPNNRSSQEVTKYSEDIIPGEITGKNNSHRELNLDENSLPKPSFSYRQQSGRSSPTTSGRKSASEVLPDEEILSIASPEIFDNNEDDEEDNDRRENKSITNNHDSKFDKLLKENKEKKVIMINDNDKDDEINENRSQSKSKSPWRILPASCSQNSQSGDLNIENNNKSKKNERIERWKLDPTVSVVEETDVPLKEINRPDILEERIPYRFCHDKKVLEKNIGEKVLTVLTRELGEVADTWRIKHRSDDSYEIQWGSPIKVGANNRSLDKKPIIEDADSSERCEYNFRKNTTYDTPSRRNTERNCKRKAAETIRDLVDNDEINSDEDKDDIFEKSKKSKKNDGLWTPAIRNNFNKEISERNLLRQDKMFNNMQNSNNKPERTTSMIDDYESDEFDNDDLKTLRRKSKKKDEEIASGSLSPEVFPRRIVPPNPSKPKIIRRGKKNGEKNRKKSPVRKTTQGILERNENSGISIGRGRGRGRNQFGKKGGTNAIQNTNLSEDEILNELENDKPLEIDLDEEIEIKPMPIKGGLANKLQQGTSLLLENKKAEERLKQAKIQEEEEFETEERLRKEQIEINRYLKEKAEEKEREIKEQQIKAKEAAWNKNISVRDRERRRRHVQEKNRNAQSTKGVLLMDEDEDEDNGDTLIDNINARQKSMEERVQCPICQLEFSKKEIQDHAADCNQFDNIDKPGTSPRAATDDDELTITQDDIHDCNICSRFTTRNGIAYEEHVHNCLRKKNNASPAGEIIEVPSSPIRSFVPISEQVGSSINYAEQFPGQRVKQNFNQRTKKRR